MIILLLLLIMLIISIFWVMIISTIRTNISFSRQVSPDSVSSSKVLGDDIFGKQLSTGSQSSLSHRTASNGWAVGKQLSAGSQNSQPTRATSNGSAKKVSPDVRMVSEKRQCAPQDGRKKSTETMPRVSKTCPLLLDSWSPDPEWEMPSSNFVIVG